MHQPKQSLVGIILSYLVHISELYIYAILHSLCSYTTLRWCALSKDVKFVQVNSHFAADKL
jgi:hypothetical protein